MRTHYDTLAVPTSTTQDAVKVAFRALAHKHHPDKPGGNAEVFKGITAAYAVLSDPAKRRSYDLQMGIFARPASTEHHGTYRYDVRTGQFYRETVAQKKTSFEEEILRHQRAQAEQQAVDDLMSQANFTSRNWTDEQRKKEFIRAMFRGSGFSA